MIHVANEMERLRSQPALSLRKPVFLSKQSSLKIASLNVRWYLPHLLDIKADTLLAEADIVCFQETFLTLEQESVDAIRNEMNMIRQDRRGSNRGGGVMIQASKNITTFDQPLVSIDNIEYLPLIVVHNGMIINVVTVYVKPDVTNDKLYAALQKLLSSLNLQLVTIIVGDFNVDLRKYPDHKILSFMLKRGLRQVVNKPTTDYGSILDHAYVNFNVLVDVDVVDTYYSDHDAVCLSIGL